MKYVKYLYIIFSGLVFSVLSCNKDNELEIESKNYQRNSWEPVIDSLSGQYFGGLDIGWNGQIYANYWKEFSGQRPATIISDDGVNWRRISKENPIDGNWTYLKRHKETILAGTPDNGLYYSQDNGVKWTKFSNFNWQWPEIIKSNNEYIVISDFRTKTFISGDDANSWRELFPKYMRVINLQKDKIVTMKLGTIMQSEDWGKTWTYDSSLAVQEKESLNSIGLGIINGQTIAAINKGIFKKNPEGNSWTNIGKSLLYNDIGLMFIDNDKLIIQTSTDGNFYFSNNLGQKWSYFGQGLPVYYTYQGIVSTAMATGSMVKKGGYLFITTNDGFFKRKVE